MPVTSRLAPLLDGAFLLALARHLYAARNRLALRTGGNLPSPAELVLALRLYIARRDRERLASSSSPSSTPQQIGWRDTPRSAPVNGNERAVTSRRGSLRRRTPPPVHEFAYYLAIADAAYALTPENLVAKLEPLRVSRPIAASQQADKWQPGFFIAEDKRHSRLVIAVRGSKEMGDLITNLSADVIPFLSGAGHEGIIRSAHNLHALVRPRLARLVDRKKPARGLVVVGHSLGGAVASALTMLLRSESLDREYDELNESMYARAVFRNTKCFSFAAPPFLTEDLARESRRMDMVTLVAGFDIVPRLSAASLDRLLTSVSRYNWGRDVNDSFGRTVENVAASFVDSERARSIGRALMQHGVTGLSLASGAIAQSARAALETRRGERSASNNNGLWGLALSATTFVASMVSEGLASSEQRRGREPEYGFARTFGMSEEDVERVLVHEAPGELFLAGVVWHLEKPYVQAGEEDGVRAMLVERRPSYFRDIEPCSWMLNDHHPEVIMEALETTLP